ncbi:hypothetical protein SFHH103_00037 [Sinorhizobium fredii HH103]|uniref:Uncharacterized protein n=1 Tax=Sinorhizobium fredii (strain HH103) TaxID=1117943 RepID=G9A9V0_SINF1|nr:hypothetical protein SFHH103_00037 [Sinorhizobium fredii HH103]
MKLISVLRIRLDECRAPLQGAGPLFRLTARVYPAVALVTAKPD